MATFILVYCVEFCVLNYFKLMRQLVVEVTARSGTSSLVVFHIVLVCLLPRPLIRSLPYLHLVENAWDLSSELLWLDY